MKCPECGRLTVVLETRGSRRRRACAKGHRFTTEEVTKAELSARWDNARSVIRAAVMRAAA